MKWEPITVEGKELYDECGHGSEGAKRFGEWICNQYNLDELKNLEACVSNESECENYFEAAFVYDRFNEAKRRIESRREKLDSFVQMISTIQSTVNIESEENLRRHSDDEATIRYINLLDDVENQMAQIKRQIEKFY